jgi:formylglycine-generating enzyme required for sulfatase activity
MGGWDLPAPREIGLLSYARADDVESDNLISQIREELEKEISALRGYQCRIRQDTKDRKIGGPIADIWTFNKPVFLFAIVTPRYISSKACLKEWKAFEQYERRFRLRNKSEQLIYPIYFIDLKYAHRTKLSTPVFKRWDKNWYTDLRVIFDERKLENRRREIKALARDIVSNAAQLEKNWRSTRATKRSLKTQQAQLLQTAKGYILAANLGNSIQLSSEMPDSVLIKASNGVIKLGDINPERLRVLTVEPIQLRESRVERDFKIGTVPVTFTQWEWVAKQVYSSDILRDYIEQEFRALSYPYRSLEQFFPLRHDDEGFGRDTRPVIHVTWFGAQAYCFALTYILKKHCRLPSETEWEFCCRAGTNTNFPWGDEISKDIPSDFVIFDRHFNGTTPLDRPSFQNAFGLRHMHGQVWEWVEDFYTYRVNDAPSAGGPFMLKNIDGPLQLHEYPRVVRGGSWTSRLGWIRSASRSMHLPHHHHHNVGFRIVIDDVKKADRS